MQSTRAMTMMCASQQELDSSLLHGSNMQFWDSCSSATDWQASRYELKGALLASSQHMLRTMGKILLLGQTFFMTWLPSQRVAAHMARHTWLGISMHGSMYGSQATSKSLATISAKTCQRLDGHCNRDLLLEMCTSASFVIANTFFPRPLVQKVTYFNLTTKPMDEVTLLFEYNKY